MLLLPAYRQAYAQDWNTIIKRAAGDRENKTPAARNAFDQFGYSVSISGDYAIAGAYFEDQDTNEANTLVNAGSAYIFSRNQGGTDNWGLQRKITAPVRAIDDYLGYSVAISGDYAIVGAYQEDEDSNEVNTLTNAGSAYVLERLSSLHYRTVGNATFASPTNWESSPDGSTWSAAASAPDGTANTLAITIRNGHTATVDANLSLDELTIQGGGTLQVNTGITLTISDGTGTDFTVQNGGILDIQVTGTLAGAGSFTLDAGGTFRTANTAGFNAVGVSGTETFTTGANYIFNGTALQTINNPTSLSANNLTLDNSAGAVLSNDLSVTSTLTITSGDLDLNNRNIDLGTTGALSEDRANNHLVLDNTSGLSISNKGGYLRVSGRATTGTLAEIGGIGAWLSNAGTVSIDRYHYVAAGVGTGGIRKNYEITGTPTSASLRIDFAPYELGIITPSSSLKLFRYDGTVWEDKGGVWTDAAVDFVTLTGVSAFSPWTVGEGSTGLPVSLLAFNAARLGTSAEVGLIWATASEQNNKGFEVEVSADGQVFKQIGFVEGAGNSLTRCEYRYATSNAEAAYYRLRQVDANGAFTYSPVRYVEGVATAWQIFPNPSDGKMTLHVGDNSNPAVSITNTLGLEVWRGTAGDIDLSGAAAGVYYVRFTHAGKPQVARVVIR